MKIKKNLDILVFEKLKESIVNAEWKSGDILNIDELAQRFEISRTPILHAVRRLAAEGIVDFLPNGKAWFPIYSKEEIMQIFETRLLLESKAAECICERKLPVADPKMKECIQRCKDFCDSNEPIAAAAEDLQFHRMLVGGLGNNDYLNIYAHVQGRFISINYLNLQDDYVVTVKAREDHFKIFDALAVWDYKAVNELLESHVYTARDKIVKAKTISS